ncbi:hypothetical protein CMV_020563 [Castanea mollissima]|uniref:Uncharacterized protein n=1 Tax=Castanea mollissima TaxID=60419 RepID=A0A8J4QMY7_9ROSI|nr:hypothetical protein CMV_020563 [Castanea mollissima]
MSWPIPKPQTNPWQDHKWKPIQPNLSVLIRGWTCGPQVLLIRNRVPLYPDHLGCDQEPGKKCGPSRKRIGTEIGRLGRNIRWKLMCGFFPKEGTGTQTQTLASQEARRIEASVQGEKVFFGVISSNARTSIGALLEAMLKAVLTAKEQGFQLVLVLSNSRSLLQTYKRKSTLDWLDSTRLADLCFLNQNGFFCDVFWVPSVVVNSLKSVARLATRVPIHHCWFSSVG